MLCAIPAIHELIMPVSMPSYVLITPASAKLLLLYGAKAKSNDSRLGISRGERPHTPCLSGHATPIPIYGEASTFTVAGKGRPCVMAQAEVLGVKALPPPRPLFVLAMICSTRLDFFFQTLSLSSMQPPPPSISTSACCERGFSRKGIR